MAESLIDFYTLKEHPIKDFNREHVLPSFLGGKDTVKILRTVNDKLGKEFDVPLERMLSVFLTILDARNSRSKNSPRRSQNIEATTGEQFTIFPGGEVQEKTGKRLITIKDGRLTVEGSFSDRNDFIQALKPHLRKLSRPT